MVSSLCVSLLLHPRLNHFFIAYARDMVACEFANTVISMYIILMSYLLNSALVSIHESVLWYAYSTKEPPFLS